MKGRGAFSLRRFSEDTRGAGYLRICVLLLALAAVLSAVLFYAEQMAVLREIRADLRQALDSMAMQASVQSYREERNGSAASFSWDEEVFLKALEEDFQGVTVSGQKYSYTADGMLRWELQVASPEASGEGGLFLRAACTASVPVRFGGRVLFVMDVPMEVTSNRKWKAG